MPEASANLSNSTYGGSHGYTSVDLKCLHLDIRLQYDFKDSIFTQEVFDCSQSVWSILARLGSMQCLERVGHRCCGAAHVTLHVSIVS